MFGTISSSHKTGSYTQENENESYCNAYFNKDGEIEYYTPEKKTDGYSFWKYKLKENLTKEAAEESGLWNYKRGMVFPAAFSHIQTADRHLKK